MGNRGGKSWGSSGHVDSTQRALTPPDPRRSRDPAADEWPPSPRRYPLTLALAGVTLGVFAVQLALGAPDQGGPVGVIDWLSGLPIAFVALSPFLHGSVAHLGWNVGVFVALGPALEVRCRPPVFLSGVVGAGWVTNVAPSVLPGGTIAGVGLSGATHAMAVVVLPFALDAAIRSHGRRRVAAVGGLLLVGSMAVDTFLLSLGVVSPGRTAVQAHVAGLAVGAIASFFVAPQFAPDRRQGH